MRFEHFFLLLSLILLGCTEVNKTKSKTSGELIGNLSKEEKIGLKNIQNLINKEFEYSFIKGNCKKLDSIQAALNKFESAISKYWEAYVMYEKSLFYYSNSNHETAEKLLGDAILALDKSPKFSENYALQGILQGFSIKFKEGYDAATIGNKTKKSFSKALTLEPKNLRAYLGLAYMDLYTPIKYGGGKKVEEYLNKALTLDDQILQSDYLPSWGRSECYFTLISHYIKTNKLEEARLVFREAIRIFPDDYRLNKIAQKLI